MNTVIKPDRPVRAAIVGAGNRSSTIYLPLLNDLLPWIKVCAVCDPVREHADKLAAAAGAKAYYDIHELVGDPLVEAAVVITPVDSHHSISVFLSEHKIHHMVETTWCSTQKQALQMIGAAEKNGVVSVVAENFFRFAIDRFAGAVKDSGYIGDIHRIYSYNDHTGYHNNSRWIRFTKSYPESVQSVTHTMPTRNITTLPSRSYDSETFRARYYTFPGNFMVIDSASNIKGFLGRQCRPGYTEWQGGLGTLIHRGLDGWKWESCVKKTVDDVQNAVVSEVIYETPDERFTRAYADTPEGIIEYINPFVPVHTCEHINKPFYGCAVMDEMIDFALAVRGVRPFEFSPHDAMMSLTMELAADESVKNDGQKIKIGGRTRFETEETIENKLTSLYNCDPYDTEAMLAISYPRK